MMTRFVNVHCSNVAYHGELEKKAAMEQKRVMSGENGEHVGDGEFQKFQNFVPDLRIKNHSFTINKIFSKYSSFFCLQQIYFTKSVFVFSVTCIM
jgi:hypothetical protein